MRKVGMVGLGRMGSVMARRLVDDGWQLWVHNRTPERAAPILERGATWAPDPRTLASEVDVALTMVADDHALCSVVLGETGLFEGAHPGLIYVDMSTVSVTASKTVADAASAAGIEYLRAPVTGSTRLAESGALGLLVSGPERALEEVRDLFAVLGKTVFYLGREDQARVMKLALNLLVAHTVAGLGEALAFGACSGLSWNDMLDVFCDSAVASPLVQYKAPGLKARDFTAAFSTEMMAKDLDIALSQARAAGASMPLTALSRELLQAAEAFGWGNDDFSSVALLFEQLSRVPRPSPSGDGRRSGAEGTQDNAGG